MTEERDPTGSRWYVAPYLIVDDVIETANYYRDKLGFTYGRFWGEPPAFCIVHRRGVSIMLSQFEEQGRMNPNRLADPRMARGMPISGLTTPMLCTRNSSRRA